MRLFLFMAARHDVVMYLFVGEGDVEQPPVVLAHCRVLGTAFLI